MKIRYIFLSLLFIAGFSSCEKELISHADRYTKIYMPQAIDYPAVHPLIMADTLQSFFFGAAYGGVAEQSQTIEVQFKVDPTLVESFNLANQTDYVIMPEGSYELENTEAVISAGQLNTKALKIKVKTVGGIEPLKQYLLPVSIAQIKPSLPLNETLRTAYFLIQGTYEDFIRSDWQVIDFSSQQAPNVADNIFDNNTATNWHTKWRGGSPPHPHQVTVDMMEVKSLHGFYFWPAKTGNGNPKNVHIDVSTDGSAWQNAGDFVFVNTFERQSVYLNTTMQARYFKVTIKNSTGNTPHTHPAEIGAF